MTKATGVYLKPGRDKSVHNRHPWIFSGGVQFVSPDIRDGDVVSLYSAKGDRLGVGFYNSQSQIQVRLISGARDSVDTMFWNSRLTHCWQKREALRRTTTAFRVVHGESDGVPGVVIDVFDSVVVLQLSSLGAVRIRQVILDWIIQTIHPKSVLERSDSPSLAAEGMTPRHELCWGNPIVPQTIIESGLTFNVDPENGQKTGFFLDQRDNRRRVHDIAPASMLNLFSYSGGFTVAAAVTGSRTVSVDSSASALGMIPTHLSLNGQSSDAHQCVEADVFDYLRQTQDHYDLVVVDPPALVKRKSDVDKAARAYKDVNRLSFRQVNPGGMMLSCSCSQFVDWTLFRQILFAAAVESGRDVQIIGQFSQPSDHPVNIFFPEGEYLKTCLLRVF